MTLHGSKGSINIDLYHIYIFAYLVKDYAHRLVNPWPASPARASGIANAPGFAKDASIAGKFIRGGGSMHVNGQKGWSPVIQLHAPAASTWNQDEVAFRHPSVFAAISPLQVWWRQQLRAARNAGLAKKRSREVVADRDVMDEGTAQVPGFVSGWDGPEPQVTLELQNKSGSPARLNKIQISSNIIFQPPSNSNRMATTFNNNSFF